MKYVNHAIEIVLGLLMFYALALGIRVFVRGYTRDRQRTEQLKSCQQECRRVYDATKPED